jgi:cyclopropane-fatty-acyl-phospholipid synthase
MASRYRKQVEQLLQQAGIEVNGSAKHDIQVHDDRFYKRVMSGASLGLGESYVEGWWDCERLDVFFTKLLRSGIKEHIWANFWILSKIVFAWLTNWQSISQSKESAAFHYNLSNKLFRKMLDKHMNYTCAYWKEVDNLDDAQLAKLDLSCRKLHLEPGMTVLDIGCGWGNFAKYAAENYDVKVTGITLSEDQVEHGSERCKDLPVEIRLQDYRELEGETYDRIVSLGMFEHVGYANYREFFEVAERCLKENGIFLLHTIGSDKTTRGTDPWLQKYIFPGSHIPSLKRVSNAFEELFIMEDLHNFGPDYDKTLMAWYHNFKNHWPELKDDFDERFYRIWTYFLQCCAATFRARKNHLWQMIFTKKLEGGYTSVR